MPGTRVRRGAAGLALVVQAAVLFVPQAPQVSVPSPVPLDKIIHIGIFAAATWSLIWAGGRRPVVIAAMVAYAPVSELIQHHWLRDRTGDAGDVVADLAGVALGAGVASWSERRSQGCGPGTGYRPADGGGSPVTPQ